MDRRLKAQKLAQAIAKLTHCARLKAMRVQRQSGRIPNASKATSVTRPFLGQWQPNSAS